MPASPPISPSAPPPPPWRVYGLSLVYAAAMAVERRAPRLFPLAFPRSHAEIVEDPAGFLALVRYGAGLPSDAVALACTPMKALSNEPAKNATAGGWVLRYRAGGQERALPVFVKLQSGRGMPLALQAIRAAVEPGVAREVDFYRYLAAAVPVRVAKPYSALSRTRINRVFLALEHVEAFNPVDWQGCPLSGIAAILGEIARMNALWLGRAHVDPRTSWIPARAGLDYASFVSGFLQGAPDAERALWSALQAFWRDRPVTLVHGDCRPGNMLFQDPTGAFAALMQPRDEGEVSSWEDALRPSVIVSDWEAVNIAPLWWDFTYCTLVGLRVADRRAYLPRLREGFAAALASAGVPAALVAPERAALEIDLLVLVLAFVGKVVIKGALWAGQGNTDHDIRAWTARIASAVQDVDALRAAAALQIPSEIVSSFQSELHRVVRSNGQG